MREIAVTRVSMAEPYSLQDASETLKWDVETCLNSNFVTIIENIIQNIMVIIVGDLITVP